MKQLNHVYIGVGTNVGNKHANINRAYELISTEIGDIQLKSSIYITPPWGFEASEDFYNSVVYITTKLTPIELLKALKSIENKMGRKPKKSNQYESRIIDLDIIDFNNQVYKSAELSIPHQFLTERNFVAFPLNEICPNWLHPITKKSINEICHNLNNEISKF